MQGLVGGVVALVVLAVRAAIEGRPGVTFGDLETALAVGIALGIVPMVLGRLIAWRMRRSGGPGGRSQWETSAAFANRTSREPSGFGSRGMDRFDKFTDRARKVLTLAQDEAQRFNHNYIGTEHLLLGLVREGEGIAAGVLESMGVNLDRARAELIRVIGSAGDPG
jgi:hypothetical protein